MRKIILSLLIIATTFAMQAQSFEGEIVFKYTYELEENQKAMEAYLPKEMTIKVKNNLSRVDQNLGMGMKMTVISDSKKKTSTVLMDIMGQKIAYTKTTTKEEQKKQDDAKITITKETKTIAGYKCTKAIIVTDGNTVTAWFTKELPAMGEGSAVKGIDGFMMEYSMDMKGIKMTISASSITKKSIPASAFEIPEGYTVKTEKEMRKMIPGMGK